MYTCIPFVLDILTDTFRLRETSSIDLPLAGIGLPSGASKHKKNKHKDRSRKLDPNS